MFPFIDVSTEVISSEISKVNNILKSEYNLRNQLISYMDKISTAVNNIVNPIDLNFIHNCLADLRKNLDNVDDSILSLKSLVKLLKSFQENSENINIENYNSLYEKNFNKHLDVVNCVSTFMESLIPYINIYFPEFNSKTPSTQTHAIQEPAPTENPLLKDNTLIISAKDNKVILPFRINELNEKLEDNKAQYNTIYDIIKELYTVPLDMYKNSSLARFKEAFNLIRIKEKGSLKDAFDLGFELFFNSNLNPAIITACRNLDELDIYLSCLDDNELDKFKCFDIVYEYLPTVINTKKQN